MILSTSNIVGLSDCGSTCPYLQTVMLVLGLGLGTQVLGLDTPRPWPCDLCPKSLLTSLPPDGPITFKLRPKCSTVAFLLPNYIFAARCYPRETLAVMQCLSACPSITSVHAVKMNKHIFRIYSPLGSQATLVFQYQTAWQYSNRNPSNRGVKRRWGRQKSRF